MRKEKQEKLKRWAEVKKCPQCGRKNALQYFVDVLVCRWCGFEVKLR